MVFSAQSAKAFNQKRKGHFEPLIWLILIICSPFLLLKLKTILKLKKWKNKDGRGLPLIYPQTERKNNPFALYTNRVSKYIGRVWLQNESGLMTFENYYYGFRAGLMNLLSNYIKKGLNTAVEIIPKYAPSEAVGHNNNPAAYIRRIEQLTGKNAATVYNAENIHILVAAIFQVESGKPLSELDKADIKELCTYLIKNNFPK